MKMTIINIKKIIKRNIQLFIFYFSYIIFSCKKNTNKVKWIIGVEEVANNIFFLSKIINRSVTVSFKENKFYKNNKYTYNIKTNNVIIYRLMRLFYAPYIFGYLVSKSENFFYVGGKGFFYDRSCEFYILKKFNKKIVCLFVGSDIRSIKLSLELSKKLKMDVAANYQQNFYSLEYEKEKIELANAADMYADVVFNAKVDQISYLKTEQYPFPYMYDKNKFFRNDKKFEMRTPRIVHAPSNPVIKGTQLVRAAIKKLKLEGYSFEYIELIDVSNEIVLQELKKAHIVMNEFYYFMPGLLGIEALANHCALMTSADPDIEPSLPIESKEAWCITKYWEVYDHLKYLLKNPKIIKTYADNGYEFAKKYYTFESTRRYIENVLKKNGIII